MIFTKLIKEDMKPALGVTEPGAIAYAVALAKQHTEGRVKQVLVLLNSGMYKNAFTCGIPNSSAYGNVYAAALGAVAADPDLKLESLRNITEKEDALAIEMVNKGMVKVKLDHMGSEITIQAIVETEKDSCSVWIKGSHTGVKKIEKNNQILFEEKTEKQEEAAEEGALIHAYGLKEILEYVESVPVQELTFIQEAFAMNLELLKEGLDSEKTTIGPFLYQENGEQLYSEDPKKTAQLLCNGAIEARVLGLSKPAMSITGSGAHGIIATMPLYGWMKVKHVSEETLLRGTALSMLITMYIKEYSGKLSAFCGCAIAAGTGMACGLAYMQGGKLEELDKVIRNMASGITGMICDGGNQGCAMKGIVAVDAAFRAVHLAMEGLAIDTIHGINGATPEDTMRYMGRIASPGMEKTEQVIVEIMEEKMGEK